MEDYMIQFKARYRNLSCTCVNRRVPMLLPDCPKCHGEGAYPQIVEIEPTEAGLDRLIVDIRELGPPSWAIHS